MAPHHPKISLEQQLVIFVTLFVFTGIATSHTKQQQQQQQATSAEEAPALGLDSTTTSRYPNSQAPPPNLEMKPKTRDASHGIPVTEHPADRRAAAPMLTGPPPRVARMTNDQLMTDFVLAGAHELDGGLETRQFPPETTPLADAAADSNSLTGSKLRIVHLSAPEAVQNHTNNVTLDCMFAFDKKLDRRLTIKWFFNDQVEPIYQWIPELNKRVYSDGFERFLDKSYEVSEDTEFMLQAYRLLQQQQPLNTQQPHHLAEPAEPAELPANAGLPGSLLASRLSKLAKLGGRQSRQLLESLKTALYLNEEPDYGRFRALRLLQPTGELAGRYTCLVSSLEGEDMQSTRLVVYEPPKSLSFNVTRVAASARQYNLTCRAEQVSPAPALSLHRFRAGPSVAHGEPAAAGDTQDSGHHHHHHHLLARLAGSSVRQEPLANAQLHLEPSAGVPGAYDALAWALVDESSLSSANLLTHFECRLSIEGTAYEQRQTLALQRGWHVNSAASGSRQTLVSLFSAFVSLLCLALALVSSALIFRLLRRHANNRVHMDQKQQSTGHHSTPGPGPGPGYRSGSGSGSEPSQVDCESACLAPPPLATVQQLDPRAHSSFKAASPAKPETEEEPEGVYRVPDTSYGTRYIIGSSLRTQQYRNNAILVGQQQHLPLGLATGALYCDQKPLYC